MHRGLCRRTLWMHARPRAGKSRERRRRVCCCSQQGPGRRARKRCELLPHGAGGARSTPASVGAPGAHDSVGCSPPSKRNAPASIHSSSQDITLPTPVHYAIVPSVATHPAVACSEPFPRPPLFLFVVRDKCLWRPPLPIEGLIDGRSCARWLPLPVRCWNLLYMGAAKAAQAHV